MSRLAAKPSSATCRPSASASAASSGPTSSSTSPRCPAAHASPGAIDVNAAIGKWGQSTVDGVDAPALGDPDTRTAFVFRPGAYVEIDATDMVCAWLNGTPNRGFLLVGNPAHAATSIRSDSREADHPAVLQIHLAGGHSPLLSLAAN